MKNKRNGLFVMMIVAIIVILSGYIIFQTFVNNVAGPTASETTNSTMSAGNTVFSIGPLVFVLSAIIVFIALVTYYVSSSDRYKKPSKLINFLNITTYYFGWGLISFIIISVPGYLLYLLLQYSMEHATTGSVLEIGKWIAIILGVYFGLAGLGYFVKKKIVDNWRERRKEKVYEKNVNELPKVIE